MRQYQINFKKYLKIAKNRGIKVPKWLNYTHFAHLMLFLKPEEIQKLEAVKFLVDISSRNLEREIYGLKWAKCDVVDIILQYEILRPKDKVEPIKMVRLDEVEIVLRPFIELAKRNRDYPYKNQIDFYHSIMVNTQNLKDVENFAIKNGIR